MTLMSSGSSGRALTGSVSAPRRARSRLGSSRPLTAGATTRVRPSGHLLSHSLELRADNFGRRLRPLDLVFRQTTIGFVAPLSAVIDWGSLVIVVLGVRGAGSIWRPRSSLSLANELYALVCSRRRQLYPGTELVPWRALARSMIAI